MRNRRACGIHGIVTMPAIGFFILVGATPDMAHAQPFANVKSALVDYSKADLAPRITCAKLSAFKDTEIVSIETQVVPADSGSPEHCRVSGVLSPEIGFEVNLPAQWNRRFYMIGNGGHAGEQPDDPNRAAQRASALQHGFVIATTDTGHNARKEPQATFVMSNPQKAIDYAYRAVHLTATTAKRIAKDTTPRQWRVPIGIPARMAGGRGSSKPNATLMTSTASSRTRPGSSRPASRSVRCGINGRLPKRQLRRKSSRLSPSERWRNAMPSTA